MSKAKPWENYLWIIKEILQSPSLSISQEKIKNDLGKSRSSIFRIIAPLIDGTDHSSPLLEKYTKLISGKEKIFYKLKNDLWGDLAGASLESKFYLECYKHVGYLLDSEYNEVSYDVDGVSITKNKLNKLKNKFFYLSKVQAHKFSKNHKELLDKIVKSLLNDKLLYLYYPKTDLIKSKRPRRVKPLTLCQYRDDLYLIALEGEDKSYNEKNLRTYKISRIKTVTETVEKFQYPSSWNPAKVFQKTSGLIRGEEKIARIKVISPFRETLKEKQFFNAELISQNDTYDLYDFIYTHDKEFLGQLFTYAECIEIESPLDLKHSLIQKAMVCLNRNIDENTEIDHLIDLKAS